MMATLLTASLAMAGVDQANFLWPDKNDMRIQKISKMAGEKDWPFVASSGRIICVDVWGQRNVYFIPDGKFNYRRAFLLNTDMLQMTMVNYGMNDVLVPIEKAAEVVERIAPFVAQGQMLCKHNDGPVVPGAEL